MQNAAIVLTGISIIVFCSSPADAFFHGTTSIHRLSCIETCKILPNK
jgi:hypothetical protein